MDKRIKEAIQFCDEIFDIVPNEDFDYNPGDVINRISNKLIALKQCLLLSLQSSSVKDEIIKKFQEQFTDVNEQLRLRSLECLGEIEKVEKLEKELAIVKASVKDEDKGRPIISGGLPIEAG